MLNTTNDISGIEAGIEAYIQVTPSGLTHRRARPCRAVPAPLRGSTIYTHTPNLGLKPQATFRSPLRGCSGIPPTNVEPFLRPSGVQRNTDVHLGFQPQAPYPNPLPKNREAVT